MKNIYIPMIGLAMFMSADMIAQSKETQKADKHFNRFEYVSAVESYLKLVENGKGDAYVYKQLADSYYNMYNPEEAAKWYGRVVEKDQDAETYYRYAQMLKATGKYEEANKQMAKFASKAPNDQRAKDYKANPNYLPKLLDKKEMYSIKHSDVNSDKADFGAILHNDVVYFTSARNTARKTYGWTDEPYLDIYSSTYNVDGTIGAAEPLTDLNTRWHDGPVTLSKDGKTMFYSSESFNDKVYEKDKDANARKSRVSLYRATKNGDKWGAVESMPFNGKEFSVGNPSLSADGKTLYFASDMPSGRGGIDIWKVAVNADGSFGIPENLGPEVNTEGDESFPYITEDNKVLYFASNGHQGFGGYDVFSYDIASKKVENLGKPINSEKDDFAFTFNTAKEIGFVSSNRAGIDNIYIVNPVCGVEILTVVTDAKTGAVLSNASVSILDDKKNVIKTEMSNHAGEVKYYVDCDKAFSMVVKKDGYEGNSFPVAASKSKQQKVDAALQPIEVIVTETEIILKDVYFEFNKSNITPEGAAELDKLVQVMKQNPAMEIMVKSHTDNRGSDKYNLNLSNRRAQSTVQYIISKGINKSRIQGKGFGESEPKVACGDNCTDEQHASNRRSEFMIVKK